MGLLDYCTQKDDLGLGRLGRLGSQKEQGNYGPLTDVDLQVLKEPHAPGFRPSEICQQICCLPSPNVLDQLRVSTGVKYHTTGRIA